MMPFYKTKVGPLPVWGWALAGTGGVALALYIRHTTSGPEKPTAPEPGIQGKRLQSQRNPNNVPPRRIRRGTRGFPNPYMDPQPSGSMGASASSVFDAEYYPDWSYPTVGVYSN